jgi:hypothetical protein
MFSLQRNDDWGDGYYNYSDLSLYLFNKSYYVL